MKRRTFLRQSTLSTAAVLSASALPYSSNMAVEVLNPRGRVPVSFIIDDSTALVNMAHYGIPQFGEVFPQKYRQDWRKLPREIPDSFVLEFLEWCDDKGVKGKYSMVPYPACTGWLHRFIPGWTKKELTDSLRIVRELFQPRWDIHSEMISHTRVIDLNTGLPYPDATPDFMENWEWSQERSADQLGEYIAYSLNVLKEAGFYCEGVTTPGGFGHRNIPNLAKGTQFAVREIYGSSIAHFFRDVITEPGKSVQPQIFHPAGLDGPDPTCSVHIIACTGDWFGGWDGLTPGDPDRFITPDLSKGRLVEVIETGEPAIFICHWPGIYYNGEKQGFEIFKTVVNRLHRKYDHLIWMKLSEIARYWVARTFTKVASTEKAIQFQAPFATDLFTIKIPAGFQNPVHHNGTTQIPLQHVATTKELRQNTWYHGEASAILCIDLPKGDSHITFDG